MDPVTLPPQGVLPEDSQEAQKQPAPEDVSKGEGKEAEMTANVHQDIEDIMSGKTSPSQQTHKSVTERVGAVAGTVEQVSENEQFQERMNRFVIDLHEHYGKEIQRIDDIWNKVPKRIQKYVVKAGPLATAPLRLVSMPLLIAAPLLTAPAAAVAELLTPAICTAAALLAKTGLISYKGEIKGGKIDLQKSVSIGKNTEKYLKMLVRALAMLKEDFKGADEIIIPVIGIGKNFDKMCARAKEKLIAHKMAKGDLKVSEVLPSEYSRTSGQ